MSITVERLDAEQGSSVHAQVRHGSHAFAALVKGDKEGLKPLLGKKCLVEMSFEQAASWRELPDFQDENSCIQASSAIPGAVALQGRVHNVLPIDAESSVVDLYLQAGPEFVAINSKQLGGLVPKVGSGLEIHVHGLCFYPTDT
jgi:hypothetical protein